MGKVILITGPSASGKTTLIKNLLKVFDIKEIPSITTKPVSEWKPGDNYIFKNKLQFLSLIEDENFVEYSEHYNYFYGTSALEIDNCIRDGENLYIKAINVDGALQLKRDLGRKAIVIYLDSSLNEIKRRMLKRDGSLVSKRVDAYVRENSLKIWFDLIIDTKNPQQTLEIAVDFLKEKLNLGKEESDLCDTDELMKKLTGISMEQAQNMSIEELNNVLGSKELTEEEFSILSSDLDSRWNAI